ncbi:hypothetical protein [Pseudosulfitobacter pseudonitzschiae]|uniref:hypothetical protein n=1 Tax=Pseudosulfitobacter pseudonitzschiae TaxID=1402135 RepID=UPI003B773FB1
MKILGGHDFYDGAGYGVDKTILFLRDKANHLHVVDGLEDHPFRIQKPWPYNYTPDDYRGTLEPFLVAVGGTIYPGMREYRSYRPSMNFRPDEMYFHYDVDMALDVFDRVSEYTARFIYIAGGQSDERRSRRERLKEHFSRKITKTEIDWLIERKISVLTTHRTVRGKSEVRVNHACLKDIDFYKALDPFTTHMEIQSWISGVLPQSKPVIDLSDIYKIQKAGFDTRTSFRKAPQKKRRG